MYLNKNDKQIILEEIRLIRDLGKSRYLIEKKDLIGIYEKDFEINQNSRFNLSLIVTLVLGDIDVIELSITYDSFNQILKNILEKINGKPTELLGELDIAKELYLGQYLSDESNLQENDLK